MIKNYFKTAFRSLLRNRSYTIINIAGLAAGIAVCIVIFIVIQFELSFDDYHKNKNRIYRVLTEYHHADAPDIFYGRGVPHALPASLETIPQIEKKAVFYTENNDQLLVLNSSGLSEKKFKEERGVYLTEPSFFDIFDFKWLAGNASSLKDPNNAVLTKETAGKYFGNWESAIGRTIKWNNRDVLKVTGILADNPPNTDLQVKVVISYGTGYTANFIKSTDWDGTGSSFGCFVLLQNNASESLVNTQLRTLAKKMKSPDNKDSQVLQALGKIHYDTQVGSTSGKTISKQLITALWIIAAFILLIACVNFINLATAQAVNRSKEVGVRKVLGSNKKQLKVQFLTETFLIVIAAVLLSVIFAVIVLPFISKIVELPITFSIVQNPAVLLFLLAITISVTALAGIYPSIVLARFNPINALKNKAVSVSTGGISLRRALVVFQFIIAQALIIGTLIIVKQMNYFTSQPLGFEKDAIVNIPFPGDSVGTSKLGYLRKELSAINEVQTVSFGSNTPVEDNNDNWTTFRYNHAPKETDFYAINKWSDDQYLPTYGLPLAAGRNLAASDTIKEFLVNETLLRNLGITNPQDALNKEIDLWNGTYKGPIVGVLKDFHDRSFRAPVAPVLITTFKMAYSLAGIKLKTQNALSSLSRIEKIWGTVFPEFVFEYQFLDAKVDSFYKEERKLSQLYKIFAAIAIFLSCLGLYGLASFMAAQRIKEVGIRKVLGASAANIVYLFSKEFIILIGIAFLIASPVAWFFMHRWLQDYVYRIDISWWIFLIGGTASVVIALVTVSLKAIKAAVANPVKSLRTE